MTLLTVFFASPMALSRDVSRQAQPLQPRRSSLNLHVVDDSLTPLNTNCGLRLHLNQSELIPGQLQAFADKQSEYKRKFNGTGSFLEADAVGRSRCFSLIASMESMRTMRHAPLPVVFWFHGVTDDANVLEGLIGREHGCGYRRDVTEGKSLASLALEENAEFMLLCPEAYRFEARESNLTVYNAPWSMDIFTVWEIPEQMNSSTGTPCSDSDSRDLAFLENIIKKLDPQHFDLNHIHFAGESAGGAMAVYAATCLRQRGLSNIRSIASHSSGLKVKGDHNQWTFLRSDHRDAVGECDACEFYPIVPIFSSKLVGLKLCIFDGLKDYLNPTNYTRSSQLLESMWPKTGGKVATYYYPEGHHVFMKRCMDIIRCLLDFDL